MSTHWLRVASLFLFCALAARLQAGGSGLNVVVVVNQNSTNSVQLGNYYCEKRQVPPQNLLRASWAGGNISWQKSDLQTVILTPLQSMLSARQLTNQIDYVLLCMDFPYRTENGGYPTASGSNGTTSVLFYGFKTDSPPSVIPGSCSLASTGTNFYAGTELPFRSVSPGTSRTNFLAVMLTASNVAQAMLVIDRAVASDGTFPTQTVYLAKTTELNRNIRYPEFDNAIFNTRLRGNYSMQRTNADPSYSFGNILGLEYGSGHPYVFANGAFVPGALADNLTSWGGDLFEYSGQLSILALLNFGAAGAYGTVIEPCTYIEKFPTSQTFFYQSRGFGMAECFYLGVTNPYEGVLVGEPLAAPFAQAAAGSWNNLPANALLSGTTNLSLQFTAADANHPVQQVDLFVDGTLAQTLTNIAPSLNNTLSVTLQGQSMPYTVPASSTIQSVTAGLTAVLNTTGNTNLTKVIAFAHGDRIELQSFDPTKAASQVSISVGNSAGSAPALTTFLSASRGGFLDTVAFGTRGYVVLSNGVAVGNYLQFSFTKTNGAGLTVAYTNTVGGAALGDLVQGLINSVNTNAALQGSDGVVAEDYAPYTQLTEQFILTGGQQNPQFNLRARSPGWNAAQFQATLSGSPTFTVQPSGLKKLDQNLSDLQPRCHLYVTAGLTNLPLAFAFNTTTQADGYHELTAVAYEGSHVRTQQRLAQTVRVQNTALAATFTTLMGGTNTALEATLQFSVVASTNNISKIELFSTGGSLTNVTGQSNVVFSVAGTYLGLGLHPFYAVVTASSGKQYRTETKWIRLVGADSPFPLSIASPPPKVAWPAAAGRSYDILSTTNPAGTFQPSATITPTNSAGQWTDTNAAAPKRSYRVRTTH